MAMNDDELDGIGEETDAVNDLVDDYQDDINEDLLLLAPEGEIPCVVVKAGFNPLKPKKETGIVNTDWEELAITVKIVEGEFAGDVVSYRTLVASKGAAKNSQGAAKRRQGRLKGIAAGMEVPLDVNPETGRLSLANLTAKMEGLRVTCVFKRTVKDGVAYSDITGFRPATVPEAEVG